MNKQERAMWIDRKLGEMGLARPTTYSLPEGRQAAWRVAPYPHELTPEQSQGLNGMAELLRGFYTAADKLYHLGLSEKRYEFVPEYLDQGKPARIVAVSREARFKGVLPLIMRPDLLWTDQGFIATEFDSIPGGTGILAGMESLYRELGSSLTDTAAVLAQAVKSVHKSGVFAFVVSEESSSYRDEMNYLAEQLVRQGIHACCLRPEEIDCQATGLYHGQSRVTTLYRFFELFDIDNVANGWEMVTAATQGLVKMVPPPKAYLEEKLWFALIHHPVLESYWKKALGEKRYQHLYRLIPRSHILDPRPVPPHAVIAGLKAKGQAISSFSELFDLPRSERSYVLKPSGFSPTAWGSKGVVLGRELTTRSWGIELHKALSAYCDQPFVLQDYHSSLVDNREYYDFNTKELKAFAGKSRYCPYFFNTTRTTIQAGLLVTTCPLDKPLIHGMTDAVMSPAVW